MSEVPFLFFPLPFPFSAALLPTVVVQLPTPFPSLVSFLCVLFFSCFPAVCCVLCNSSRTSRGKNLRRSGGRRGREKWKWSGFSFVFRSFTLQPPGHTCLSLSPLLLYYYFYYTAILNTMTAINWQSVAYTGTPDCCVKKRRAWDVHGAYPIAPYSTTGFCLGGRKLPLHP